MADSSTSAPHEIRSALCRLFFLQQGASFVLLLAGGDKSTQDRDIRDAKALARQF